MVLVLDCSGSMEGKSIPLAKQAAGRAVEMLGPRDQVGVLAFEDKNWWVSPLHVCTDKEQILRRIDTIAAGGETDMYPALDKAYLALRESFADLKHIIVLTDGVSARAISRAWPRRSPPTASPFRRWPSARRPPARCCKTLAATAKGHYYFCDDVARVPQIFALETSIAGKLGITEEPFFPQVVRADAVLAGLDLEHAPTLLGYVETAAQAGERGAPGQQERRPAAGLRALRPRQDRGLHLRHPEPLGGGLAALARLRPLLGAAWSARRCAGSRRTIVCSRSSRMRPRPWSRSTPWTTMANSSTAPRRRCT